MTEEEKKKILNIGTYQLPDGTTYACYFVPEHIYYYANGPLPRTGTVGARGKVHEGSAETVNDVRMKLTQDFGEGGFQQESYWDSIVEVQGLCLVLAAENGKSLPDARAELKRTVENIDMACGIPMLQQGDKLIGTAMNIDGEVIRLPMGVFTMIAFFNFPAMVPF